MSIWVILGGGVVFLILLSLWWATRQERTRLACLDMASRSKLYMDSSSSAVITRAAEFEKYVRDGKAKEKPE